MKVTKDFLRKLIIEAINEAPEVATTGTANSNNPVAVNAGAVEAKKILDKLGPDVIASMAGLFAFKPEAPMTPRFIASAINMELQVILRTPKLKGTLDQGRADAVKKEILNMAPDKVQELAKLKAGDFASILAPNMPRFMP